MTCIQHDLPADNLVALSRWLLWRVDGLGLHDIGPEAVAEGVFARLVGEWEGFTVTPDRIIESGDTVLALGRYRAVHRTTGLPLDAQFAHVWTVRDGSIVAFQQYADTAQLVRVSTRVPPPLVPSPMA